MMREFMLYSDISSKETVLELWGASTKHPDTVFHYSDFNKSLWADAQAQIIPWVLECASKLSFPYHSIELARWVLQFAGD